MSFILPLLLNVQSEKGGIVNLGLVPDTYGTFAGNLSQVRLHDLWDDPLSSFFYFIFLSYHPTYFY